MGQIGEKTRELYVEPLEIPVPLPDDVPPPHELPMPTPMVPEGVPA